MSGQHGYAEPSVPVAPLFFGSKNRMLGMKNGIYQSVRNIWAPTASSDETWPTIEAPTNEMTLVPHPDDTTQETTTQYETNYIQHTNNCINEAAKWITNVQVSISNLETSVEGAARRGTAITKQDWEALGVLKTQLVGLRGRLDDEIGVLDAMDTKVRVSPWEARGHDGWVSVTGGRPPPGLSPRRGRASTVSTAGANEFLAELPPGLGGGRVQRADLTWQGEAGRNIWEPQPRRADQSPRGARQY